MLRYIGPHLGQEVLGVIKEAGTTKNLKNLVVILIKRVIYVEALIIYMLIVVTIREEEWYLGKPGS